MSDEERTLRFRVNPSPAPSLTFALPAVAGETIAQLKARVSPHAGPHESYFVLQTGGRSLKLSEPVASLLGDDGATFDVVWTTCSHGAPTHPITGDSACFWDGSAAGVVEY